MSPTPLACLRLLRKIFPKFAVGLRKRPKVDKSCGWGSRLGLQIVMASEIVRFQALKIPISSEIRVRTEAGPIDCIA